MKKYNLLYICDIGNSQSNGVALSVPEHFINISKTQNVGLLNCSSIQIEKLKNETNVFLYNEYGKVAKLPYPFNKPDLVIFHEVYKKKYLQLYKEIKRMNIPYIIIPHGCLTKKAQNVKKIKKVVGNFLFFNSFIFNAASIQFLSEMEKNNSKNFSKKSFVSGHGMLVTENYKKDFNKNCKKLLYIGRYSMFIKGLDILLKYCFRNREYMLENSIVLDMYGRGKDEDIKKIKSLIQKYKLENLVKINGPIYDKEKENIILNHDYFIQLSHSEGQPLGIIESLIYGLPVIVSNGTTFKNFVLENNCGFVCDNEEDFYNILRRVVSNENEIYLLSKNARESGISNFSWDVVIDNNINYYSQIISDRRKNNEYRS